MNIYLDKDKTQKFTDYKVFDGFAVIPNGSTVHAYDGSTVNALDDSTVHADNGSIVYAMDGSTVYALDGWTKRLKIHGGWLVSSGEYSTTFIPDPNHEWKLEDE